MLLLHLLLQDWLNTRKDRKKSLDELQGNGNFPAQAIIESLL